MQQPYVPKGSRCSQRMCARKSIVPQLLPFACSAVLLSHIAVKQREANKAKPDGVGPTPPGSDSDDTSRKPEHPVATPPSHPAPATAAIQLQARGHFSIRTRHHGLFSPFHALTSPASSPVNLLPQPHLQPEERDQLWHQHHHTCHHQIQQHKGLGAALPAHGSNNSPVRAW